MNSVAQQTLASTAADEAEVRALYQRSMDGWNKGRGDLFAAPLAEDADLVGKVTRVRFLAPTVALMHAVGGTVMAGQTDLEPERNSVQTLVAVKAEGEWRLAAFQNTRAQYLGRPESALALTEELRRLL